MLGDDLKRNPAAQAVADEHRLVQVQLLAERDDVLGEAGDRVLLDRRVTPPMPAQVHRHNPVAGLEMGKLGREGGVVAAAAMDHDERRRAAPRYLVVEPDPVPRRPTHAP